MTDLRVTVRELDKETLLKDREAVLITSEAGEKMFVLFHTRVHHYNAISALPEHDIKAEPARDVVEFVPAVLLEVVPGEDICGPRRCVMLSTDLDVLYEIHAQTKQGFVPMVRAWFDYVTERERPLSFSKDNHAHRSAVLGWCWKMKKPTITMTYLPEERKC